MTWLLTAYGLPVIVDLTRVYTPYERALFRAAVCAKADLQMGLPS